MGISHRQIPRLHFFFGIGLLTAIQFCTEPKSTLTGRLVPTSDLIPADSGFQVDLAIALSGGSSEGPAPSGFFSSAEDALKRRVT